jgi:hypothetical protein
MNFIATLITELQTFLVQNQQIDLGLTLKCRSMVKYERIFEFLEYDILYLVNTQGSYRVGAKFFKDF